MDDGLLERGDRGVARFLRGLEALLRGGEVPLQLGGHVLLGHEGGLLSLACVALLVELLLKFGVLGGGLLFGAVGALDRGLRTLLGLLGTHLGALGFIAGELRVLLSGVAFKLGLLGLLERPPALLLGGLRARERRRAALLRLPGEKQHACNDHHDDSRPRAPLREG